MQVSGVHSTPTLTALIGDPAFWAGTEYESLSYQPQGDFVPQYGQHDVELVEDDSLPEGQYLLRMYDNNYWSLSTRDDYEPELPDSVGTSLTGGSGIHSYVTYYLVDSNAKTFSLAKQFPVTYSSIVSNAQSFDGNYVVNSGVAHEFGEYDSEGNLIRAFSYDCMMNGYRVMKGAAFVKGESGPHLPKLDEKWTQPPRPYTEATLLRAMETAGKLVDNDELRDALKENGIGRPSTRAAIIETLFKRHYIRKERKNLIATPTGIELVGLIREELLKSAELTGIWEKKLREIEKKSYDATTFLNELKQMVSEIVYSVLSDNTNRRVTTIEETATKTATTSTVKQPKKKAGTSRKNASSATPAPTIPSDNELVGKSCPLCGKGTIIKGKTAYGCSEWKNGCTYRKPF